MAVARNCGSLPRLGARHYFGFLCLSFLCGLSCAAVGQEKPQCNLPDCNEAKAFFQKFQQAVDSDQKPEVVAMIRYPLHSYRNGKATVFKTKTQLLASYDTVFAAGVRCAIKTATLDGVWGNWRGFTISAGAIWWDRIIPSSATSPQPSDLSKYPFGVFGVNHSPETDKDCTGNDKSR